MMPNEEQTITRAFATELVEMEGRTIVGRCVPYGVTTTVADQYGTYQERVMPGAFRRVVKWARAGRVLLNYGHGEALSNVIGSATSLEERDDGLYATFQALAREQGEVALELIRSGATTGLSVQATVHAQGSRTVEGVLERTLFKTLHHVALTNDPAYEGAGVLAVRSGRGDNVTAALARNEDLRARYIRT